MDKEEIRKYLIEKIGYCRKLQNIEEINGAEIAYAYYNGRLDSYEMLWDRLELGDFPIVEDKPTN